MADVDYFLTLDGVAGESRNAQHAGAIELESFAWGETQVIIRSGEGGTFAGDVTMQAFRITMLASKASPRLFLACASGHRFASAAISAQRSGAHAQDFLRWTLSDVMITAFQTDGADGTRPRDQVSLVFGSIVIHYQEQLADGTLGPPLTAGWDVATNKPLP